MHLFQRFRSKDPRAVILAAFQMRNHEMRHVDAAGREAPGRCRDDNLIGLRGLRSERVAFGHVGLERRRQRLTESRMRHLKRLEQMGVKIIVERLPRHTFNNVTAQARSRNWSTPVSIRP
jgi:hypothetical protein